MANQTDLSWIYQLQTGGPQQSSVVIKANPAWASLVTNRMKPYKSMPDKFKPALEAVADYYRGTAVPKVFKNEGPGWRKLSKRTQGERARAGFHPQHPILQRTGDLFRELTDKVHPKHVEIVKVGRNSRVEIGGSSEKYIRNQLGNSFFNIPARPMLPGTGWIKLDPADELEIRRIFTEKILEQVHNARV